jgi:hypothetical protein
MPEARRFLRLLPLLAVILGFVPHAAAASPGRPAGIASMTAPGTS